ncbi:MAG: extracellular solute-binding protein [Clostridiales bacterium]|jgi:raffinose/stachyose/melibiose transport system substrate-binding protein|nr:extracellular solute-binding protein [Clostridiales bacterium]
MKSQRLIAMAITAVTALSMTAGCAGGAGSTSGGGTDTNTADTNAATEAPAVESSESKEIIFWNIAVESPDKEIISYAVDQFNANTTSGYTVTQIPTQNDTYKEKLVIAMSSGECPDIYTSWSGGPMNEYIEAGFAQPIDDLVNASDIKDKLMEAAWAQGQYKGKQYSVPTYNISISGVFYNKEMFDKYGLKVPNSVSELEAICDTLVENGITPFALANASKWTGSMYFMSLATRFDGLEPFNAAADGSGSFEDESYVYAGEKIQEWVGKKYFPDGVNSLSEDDGQAKQLMYQEKAAMLLCGSWYTGTFQTDSPEFYEKIGWFSFPAVDGSSSDPSIQIGTIGDQFLQFNITGDKLAAAFEMATYYSSDDAIKLMVDSGKIPPVKNIADLVTDPVTKDILDACLNASSTQLWYDQYLPPAVAEVHKDTSQELFGLTMTPQEANAKLQEAMQSYLADK